MENGGSTREYTSWQGGYDLGSYAGPVVITWETLANGTNNIHLFVEDNAGNYVSGSTIFTFKKDTEVPTYTILNLPSSGSEGIWYGSAPVWSTQIGIDFEDLRYSLLRYVTCLLYDNNGTLLTQLNVLNSGGVGSYNEYQTISWNALIDGTNNIVYRLENGAGSVVTTPIVVTVKKDTVCPVMTNNDSHSFDSWYKDDFGKLHNIDVFFNDPLSGISYVGYQVTHNGMVTTTGVLFSGGVTSNYVSTWSINWSDIGGGINNIYNIVQDQAGNVISFNPFVVKVDSGPPQIINSQNIAGSSWYGLTMPSWMSGVQVYFRDDQSGLSGASYCVSGNTGQSRWVPIFSNINVSYNATPWGVDWTLFPTEGAATLYIRASDNSGWVEDVPLWTISRDIVAPQIVVTEDGTAGKYQVWYNSDPGLFRHMGVSYVDNGSGIQKTRLGVQNGSGLGWDNWATVNVCQSMSGVSFNWGLLSEGENDLYVDVMDSVGNEATGSMGVHVLKDITAPSYVDNGVRDTAWHKDIPSWISAVSINFVDSGGSGLKDIGCYVSADQKVQWSGYITQNMGSGQVMSYTAAWGIPTSGVTNGINEIYLVMRDNAGNGVTSGVVFRFFWDGVNPTYVSSENAQGAKFSIWYNEQTKPSWLASMNVRFGDSGGSHINVIQYGVSNNGSLLYYNIAYNLGLDSYSTPWGLNWSYLGNGTSDILVKVKDIAGNETDSGALFDIYKDVIPP